MVFDLRKQDFFQRHSLRQSGFSRPGALEEFVIPICEECIRIGAKDRKQNVRSSVPIVKKNLELLLESHGVDGQPSQARQYA